MCKFKNLHNVSLDYAAFIAVNCSSAMLLSFGNAHTKWASRRGFVCAPAFLMSPLERNAHTKWIEGLDAYKYLENTLIYMHFSVCRGAVEGPDAYKYLTNNPIYM